MPSLRSSSRALAAALLAAVLIGNALLRGGVWWPVQAATAVACAGALLLLSRHRPSRRQPEEAPRTARMPPLVLALVASTALVALQLLPLPPGLLAVLSPAGAELQATALAPVGLWPSWRPLSLDPGATGLELAKLAAWTMAAAAAAVLAGKRERREDLLRALAAAGAAVALACFGAALAGLGPLLQSRVIFANVNHLSAFMLLACWPALGLGLRARGAWRIAWMAAFVVAASQVFLSLSRAGIAAFFVGAAVLVALAIRSGHAARALQDAGGGARRAWRAVAAPVAIFGALAVVAWLALDRVVGELRTLSELSTEVKLTLWPLAWDALRQFPLTGVGRGGFSTVFDGYKVEAAQVTFTHLENTWLQVPLDVGIPAGVAFLAVLGWTWIGGARSRTLTRPMIGALAGVAAVAAHDVFDFSLELAGVAIPFLVVLALATAEGWALEVPRRALRILAAAGLALAALGLGLHLPHRADPQAARAMEAQTSQEAMTAAAAALAWHPADWIPPAAVGYRLVIEGRCTEAMDWLGRAILRSPTVPEPHRAAARCLAASGRTADAQREFRLAFTYGDQSVLEEALDTFRAPLALLDVVPDTPVGLMAAGRVLLDREEETPEEAHEAFRRAWENFHHLPALAGLARATMAMEQADQALDLARQLQREDPTEPAGYRVAAQALRFQEKSDEAVKELEKGAALLPKRSELLFDLGNLHLAEKRYSQAKLVFERVIAREGKELSRKRLSVARALDAQGRLSEALKEARAAQDSQPGDPGPLIMVARIASRAGLYDQSIDAVERASRLPGVPAGAYDDLLLQLRQARTVQRARSLDKPAPPPAP